MIDMIKEICSHPRKSDSYRFVQEKEKSEKDDEFNKIVKFLNAQKAVMDYADLN